MLYQIDVSQVDVDGALRLYWASLDKGGADHAFAAQLVRGVMTNLGSIDEHIEGCSAHWRLQRMPVVDRGILRLGAYELIFCPDIPPRVALDEAIELAHTFGAAESAAFVNGVLACLMETRVATR